MWLCPKSQASLKTALWLLKHSVFLHYDTESSVYSSQLVRHYTRQFGGMVAHGYFYLVHRQYLFEGWSQNVVWSSAFCLTDPASLITLELWPVKQPYSMSNKSMSQFERGGGFGLSLMYWVLGFTRSDCSGRERMQQSHSEAWHMTDSKYKDRKRQ